MAEEQKQVQAKGYETNACEMRSMLQRKMRLQCSPDTINGHQLLECYLTSSWSFDGRVLSDGLVWGAK